MKDSLHFQETGDKPRQLHGIPKSDNIEEHAGVCVAVMGTREGDIEREENKESRGQRQGVHVMQGDFTVLDFTILEEHYEREKFSSLQKKKMKTYSAMVY